MLFFKQKGFRGSDTNFSPSLSIVIAAYNEAGILSEKIQNTRELKYNGSKQIIVISDGSNDNTASILEQFPDVLHLHQNERLGKTAALNRAIQQVTGELCIFTDANTMLSDESVVAMIKHFENPEVGGVSGEKKILETGDSASGSGEGLYWKYESKLKKLDSDFYSVCGAPGEFIGFRTALYPALPNDTILDDFMLSMLVCSKGYRFIYEPKAIASELPSQTMDDEWKRKVRICAGGFQSIGRIGLKVNPFKKFKLFYVYFSHRIMRWAVAPFCLVVLFASNFYIYNSQLFYQLVLFAQIGFYLLGLAGYILRNKKVSIKGFFVAYYFIMMNLAAIMGLVNYLSGRQSAVWEKASR